ncbi:MAG: ABC-F family ATP-binding cassette domain-containing protein [Clostridia bacterium]|nr:ABC-F family ATP-binding cassette domain-containing protein [Clostridia bacterium]
MALLSLSNISKSFGSNLILENISFEIENLHKIGLIGPNGAGKTTLFKIICDQLNFEKGEIYKSKNTKIGYTEQFACQDSSLTLLDELLTVFNDLIVIEQRLKTLESQISLAKNDVQELVDEQHSLTVKYEEKGGYTYRSIAKSTLIGLGFEEKDFLLPVSNLSGGQKTKLSLAKMLLSNCNLLLLDEPTNNLDISSMEWLENFLNNYKGSFIVISHDRYFLDKVTNETFELENRRLTAYPGNYSKYLALKDEAQKSITKKYETTQKEINRIEGIIEQQKTWSQERNYKIIRNKQKMIDRLEASLVAPEKEAEKLSFHFKTIAGGNREALVVDKLAKSFGDKKLFENISLEVFKTERVFLLGPNGCGKTTLLKILEGTLKQDAGTYIIGSNMKVAYYHQMNEDWFSLNKSILDFVWETYPKLTQTEVRSALARFLFKGEDVFKTLSSLSGGELARISLLLMMLSESNFLILDEPTNHLDIASKEALENALQEYDGTIFAVSHDRYFINKLASKVYRLTPSEALLFKGNYDFYLQHYTEEAKAKTTKEKKTSYQERKQQQAAKRKQQNQIARIEKTIEEKEQEKAALEIEAENCGADYVKAMEITEKISALSNEIASLYAEWEQLI